MNGSPRISSNACRVCPVRGESPVCRIAEADLDAFGRLLHRFEYQPRQVVFYEGHPCLGIYVLCAGKAKLTTSSSRGHRRIVRLVGAGELIECNGFSEGAVHEVTCETLEPSRLCLINRQGYLALLEKYPSFAVELLQLVSRRVMTTTFGRERIPFCKTTERLAALLIHLSRRFGHRSSEGLALGIRLTREELGELIGAAPETVIRLISRFKRERLVGITGEEILLLKPERLSKIASPLPEDYPLRSGTAGLDAPPPR
ncbi:MAG: Crp/Fnr family transcriptional regulator [Nitrospirae bacterium]|nr:Crp/Fnr family transcriptional regulator [Nitrospirota bacterium]